RRSELGRHSFPTRRSSDLSSSPLAVPSAAAPEHWDWFENRVETRRLRITVRELCIIFFGVQYFPYAIGGSMQRAFRIVLFLLVRSEEHTSELQSLTNLVCP